MTQIDELPKRPKDSNADAWHLFLSEYLDSRATSPSGMTFMAVQIAEAIDDALEAQATRVKELEKERDNARANSVSRGRMLIRLRDRLINICDYLDDQGDLVAFRSTNDADDFRTVVNDLDMFKWDMIIRENDEDDLLSASARACARADKAEAERDALQARIAELKARLFPEDQPPADQERDHLAGQCKTLCKENDALQSQVRALREALEPYAKAHIDGVYAWPKEVHYRAREVYDATASLDLCIDWKSRAEAAERERDSLRKALDARWEADCKAAKEIMAAEGRTTGFPSVKDVVGFYMAQAEKLAEVKKSRGIYVASKTRHASMWRELRDVGWPIRSTWIDEAGEGESKCLTDLWRRCIGEACSADALLLYCAEGDILKGAWVELGASLAHGRKVFAVGIRQFTVANHELISHFDTIEEALSALSDFQRAKGGES